MTEPVYAGELRVDAIPPRREPVRFAPYSSYPPIEADLSFTHSRETSWRELERFVKARNLANLGLVRVVDRYEGRGVAEGKVKTTIRLTFRSSERTLEQEEVNGEVAKLRDGLLEELGAQFE
jgi:phenylalanyl-tRNA synthetase beta chain